MYQQSLAHPSLLGHIDKGGGGGGGGVGGGGGGGGGLRVQKNSKPHKPPHCLCPCDYSNIHTAESYMGP